MGHIPVAHRYATRLRGPTSLPTILSLWDTLFSVLYTLRELAKSGSLSFGKGLKSEVYCWTWKIGFEGELGWKEG